MNGNDRQAAKPDNQDNYEAAVLDFLDKEMAAVQPTKKGKEQSDDLDALVSDLMKQVMTESDQPQASNQAASEEINKLISELAPLREASPPPDKKIAPPNPHPGFSQAESHYSDIIVPKIETEKPAAVKPPVKVTPAAKASPMLAASMISIPALLKNRTALIAAALVCLLLAIGIPVFLFKGSSNPVSKSVATQPPATAPAAPAVATQPVQAPAQPTGRTKASQIAAPASNSRAAVAESSRQAPSASAQKQPATVQKPSTPVAQPTVAAVNPPSPAPVKEERPVVTQAAPPALPAAPIAAPIAAPERPSMQVTAENSAPAGLVVDKTPTPHIAANTTSNDNSALDLQSPTPGHAVPKIMVSAVPISQASPKYPELALRSRASGVIVLDLDIDSQGKVVKATPVSGPDLFHQEAINAVMKWRYKPATVGGSNVPSQSRVTLNFKLPK